MTTKIFRVVLVLAAVALAATPTNSQRGVGARKSDELSGTSWKLVKLQGDDETTSVPDRPSKYTITFGRNGRVTTRVDCNRGGSTWRSTGANQLEFGSWNMSRAKCPAGSLYNRIVTEGANVRSYSIRNGRLFLTGMSAGGYYELEPLTTQRRP